MSDKINKHVYDSVNATGKTVNEYNKDLWGFNNITNSSPNSEPITPEYLINNGWHKDGVAGHWYDEHIWFPIFTLSKTYPVIGTVYFKWSYYSQQILISLQDTISPDISSYYVKMAKTVGDLEKVMNMESIFKNFKKFKL